MVCAIIVTYQPDLNVLEKLLDSVCFQVSSLIVVDNGSDGSIISELEETLKDREAAVLIKNPSNLGVAEALNQGVHFARSQLMDYVLLLDQDSLLSKGLVKALRLEFEQGLLKGEKVGAVGPSYIDSKGRGKSHFVRLEGFRLKRISPNENDVVSVDHLITSGSLISMKALNDIGEMNRELFIDYVDTAWCLRARSKGYKLYGVEGVKMTHDLGDGFVNVMGRNLPTHAPFRYYYIIRNGIWLIRQPWVSNNWRIADIRRLFLLYLVCSFLIGSKFNNWKMMSLGLWHGLVGKMGKLDQ